MHVWYRGFDDVYYSYITIIAGGSLLEVYQISKIVKRLKRKSEREIMTHGDVTPLTHSNATTGKCNRLMYAHA